MAGSGRFAISVNSIEVEVVAAPPDDARTDDETPIAQDLEVSLAGLMGRNDDMRIYRSSIASLSRRKLAPQVSYRSRTALLVRWSSTKAHQIRTARHSARFGVTSTKVAVLWVRLADIGLVLVRSVDDGVLLKLRSRAFTPLGAKDPAWNHFLAECSSRPDSRREKYPKQAWLIPIDLQCCHCFYRQYFPIHQYPNLLYGSQNCTTCSCPIERKCFLIGVSLS